jgi:hypothetical protein
MTTRQSGPIKQFTPEVGKEKGRGIDNSTAFFCVQGTSSLIDYFP